MKLTHAGGVVFFNKGNQTLFLIISSSNGVHWVLPKGHIEPGETPQNTALREIREETGVDGEIIAELPKQKFKKFEEIIYVQYFLINKLRNCKTKENRSIKWVDEQSALKLLSFEDAKNVLMNAVDIINRL